MLPNDITTQVAVSFAQVVIDTFSINPQISLGVIGLSIGYALAVGPLRRRYGWGEPPSTAQKILFAVSMLMLFFVLQGPIHELSESYLFSMHMLQHLLITLIVPPMLLKSLPTWLVDLPLQVPLVQRVARVLIHPVIAIALFNIIFVLWHVPAFYQAALANPLIHAFEHVSMILPATLMWWPIFSPSALLPRLNEGVQVLYLFLTSIPSTILGAIITLANDILYPTYAIAPRVLGMSPISDQRTAGLLMWFGGAAVIVVLMAQRFIHWMGPDEDEGGDVVHVRPSRSKA